MLNYFLILCRLIYCNLTIFIVERYRLISIDTTSSCLRPLIVGYYPHRDFLLSFITYSTVTGRITHINHL